MKLACYIPPTAERHGREIIKRLPYVRPSVCINLNVSFIYKDIFIKFAGNDYGLCVNFSLILKNKMADIANCLKILKCSKS